MTDSDGSWPQTKKSFKRLKRAIHCWTVITLRNRLTKTLDPYVPEDHELLHALVDEKLKILSKRSCMFNEPIDPKECDHAGVWFGSGDYYIFCNACSSTWTKTNHTTGNPDPSLANVRVPCFDQSEPRVLIRTYDS